MLHSRDLRDPTGTEGVLVPCGETFVDSRAEAIAREVWDMSGGRLHMVVRHSPDTVQHYEIYERIPTGHMFFIGRWDTHELLSIPADIRALDRQAPGHVRTLDKVRQTNEAKFAAAQAEGVDVMSEFADRVEGVKRDQGITDPAKRDFYFSGTKEVTDDGR